MMHTISTKEKVKIFSAAYGHIYCKIAHYYKRIRINIWHTNRENESKRPSQDRLERGKPSRPEIREVCLNLERVWLIELQSLIVTRIW